MFPLMFFSHQPKEITWCPSRVFPPVRACMFSSRLTSVTFLADPSAGGGLPRGTFIYATCPVPIQVGISHLNSLQGLYHAISGCLNLFEFDKSLFSCRPRLFTGRLKLSPMETLRRTVAPLCPLVLPLRQRREMAHGPTL